MSHLYLRQVHTCPGGQCQGVLRGRGFPPEAIFIFNEEIALSRRTLLATLAPVQVQV